MDGRGRYSAAEDDRSATPTASRRCSMGRTVSVGLGSVLDVARAHRSEDLLFRWGAIPRVFVTRSSGIALDGLFTRPRLASRRPPAIAAGSTREHRSSLRISDEVGLVHEIVPVDAIVVVHHLDRIDVHRNGSVQLSPSLSRATLASGWDWLCPADSDVVHCAARFGFESSGGLSFSHSIASRGFLSAQLRAIRGMKVRVSTPS